MDTTIAICFSKCNSNLHVPVKSVLLFNDVMTTSKQTRLSNLHALIAEFRTADAVAHRADTAPMYLSQIINGVPSKTGRPRGIGDALARKLEEGCGKPIGWLDQAHDEDPRERELLDLFNSLDDRGRETLLTVARSLRETGAQGQSQ